MGNCYLQRRLILEEEIRILNIGMCVKKKGDFFFSKNEF